jgi:outer membrane biosynthesis protein TonB
MAKLEDLVTPSEILDVMKDGAVKGDLIKRFKTSDAELAKMLLPLYRNGQITKDEFNDFFQGRSIASEGPTPEVPAVAPSPEPVKEEPKPEAPKPVPVVGDSPKPEPAVTEAPKPAPPPAEAPKPTPPVAEAPKPTPPVVEAPKPAPPPVPEEVFFDEDEPPESAPEDATIEDLSFEEEEDVELVAELPATPPAVAEETPASSDVLEMILARLDSIDKRLAAIEKKPG